MILSYIVCLLQPFILSVFFLGCVLCQIICSEVYTKFLLWRSDKRLWKGGVFSYIDVRFRQIDELMYSFCLNSHENLVMRSTMV